MPLNRMIAKKSRFLRFHKGMTLVEVMVTLLIFAILAGAINMVLIVGQSSWQANRVNIEMLQELRKAMATMEDELRQTAPVAITAGPTDADGSTSTSITFYLPAGVSGNSIAWSSDTVQYILGGAGNNQLQRIEGGDTRVIAQNIQSVTFSRDAATPDIIDVALVVQQTTGDGRTMNLSFGFGAQMRN